MTRPYDFSRRSLFSYRRVLRDLPVSLRRPWLLMRVRFNAPRVEISAGWLPPEVQRNARYF
jgi:hypothetical protein